MAMDGNVDLERNVVFAPPSQRRSQGSRLMRGWRPAEQSTVNALPTRAYVAPTSTAEEVDGDDDGAADRYAVTLKGGCRRFGGVGCYLMATYFAVKFIHAPDV